MAEQAATNAIYLRRTADQKNNESERLAESQDFTLHVLHQRI